MVKLQTCVHLRLVTWSHTWQCWLLRDFSRCIVPLVVTTADWSSLFSGGEKVNITPWWLAVVWPLHFHVKEWEKCQIKKSKHTPFYDCYPEICLLCFNLISYDSVIASFWDPPSLKGHYFEYTVAPPALDRKDSVHYSAIFTLIKTPGLKKLRKTFKGV